MCDKRFAFDIVIVVVFVVVVHINFVSVKYVLSSSVVKDGDNVTVALYEKHLFIVRNHLSFNNNIHRKEIQTKIRKVPK